MWSTLHSRRPRQYPAENKSRLKNMERRRKDNQEMDSVVKAIPTRILSRERARLRSRASQNSPTPNPRTHQKEIKRGKRGKRLGCSLGRSRATRGSRS